MDGKLTHAHSRTRAHTRIFVRARTHTLTHTHHCRSRVPAMKDGKRWHMRRVQGGGGGDDGGEKVLPGEVFLTFMLTMKGIVQPYVVPLNFLSSR